jgi:hypothetical protein
MLTKETLCYKLFSEIKTYPKKKIKIGTKEHNNRQNVNICIRNLHTNKERKLLNTFERKVFRRILGPVYDNEKENGRILTNKEIDAIVKNSAIRETIRIHRLCWSGHVQRMETNRISKTNWYMNLESTRPRGRSRHRWQNEVREDGRIVGGKE